MPRYLQFLAVAVVAALAFAVQPAQAGTIILEGSDAIGFHYNQTYTDEVWRAIGGDAGGHASPLPILVVGTPASVPIASTTHPIVDMPTLATAGPLSGYAAIYFLAGGGCCLEDDSLVVGFEPAITAYLASGGTVMIENYVGGAAWDFAVMTGGAGNAHTGGFGGGLPGPGCDDGEMVTADGMANGFTQPPVIGCWTHQGYQESFFGPLGFTHNFFDSPPAYLADNPGLGPFSSLLSNGFTLTHPAPEPSSIALLCIGSLSLLGYGVRRRMRVA